LVPGRHKAGNTSIKKQGEKMENHTEENEVITYPIQDGYETPICFNHSVSITQQEDRSCHNTTKMTREDIATMDTSDWEHEFDLSDGWAWDYKEVTYEDCEVMELSISESHKLAYPGDEYDLLPDAPERPEEAGYWTIQVGPWGWDRIGFEEYLIRMGFTASEALNELVNSSGVEAWTSEYKLRLVAQLEEAWAAHINKDAQKEKVTFVAKDKVVATGLVDRNLAKVPDELKEDLKAQLRGFAKILNPQMELETEEAKKGLDYALTFFVSICRACFDDGVSVDLTPDYQPLFIVGNDENAEESGVTNGVE
jgi:hypothetical protein